ncbi:GH25 family lysozyme [Vagococcus vulneris]|uniref:Lysozyme n=1 Tax=Vagococcus vulneris TaxID=1977869 RepID=A0A429ZQM5_9ENTE|nr:GH25 family lysozyme [Vagococcus vulneris]RST96013.1 hypothetical protein CBF37_11250 [Vagococcus vulneris]
MTKLIGYDVSNHQAGLKLSTLQSDCFIFKATEGTFFVDKTCDNFVQQAKALNKPYGVYHFLDGSDVIAQADFFVQNISGYVGEGVLILDYEMYGRQGAAQAKRFCDRVFDKTGVRCWIYMNESDCNSDNWQTLAKDYAFWIAKYSSNAPRVHDYLNVIGWQFTSTPLDKNEFYMDVNTWNKYAGGGSTVKVRDDYYSEGSYFEALQDLQTYYPDWKNVDKTVFMKKGTRFPVRNIQVTPSGTTHAYVAGLTGTVVTLAKSHVKRV